MVTEGAKSDLKFCIILCRVALFPCCCCTVDCVDNNGQVCLSLEVRAAVSSVFSWLLFKIYSAVYTFFLLELITLLAVTIKTAQVQLLHIAYFNDCYLTYKHFKISLKHVHVRYHEISD